MLVHWFDPMAISFEPVYRESRIHEDKMNETVLLSIVDDQSRSRCAAVQVNAGVTKRRKGETKEGGGKEAGNREVHAQVNAQSV
jgi:hypothetical protein